MDNLKRKLNSLSLLKRKNKMEIDRCLHAYTSAMEKYRTAVINKQTLMTKLSQYNDKLKSMLSNQLDVESIKRLNCHMDLLENQIKQAQHLVAETKHELDEKKLNLTNWLKKNKAIDKIHVDAEKDYFNELEKIMEREIGDDWNARRFA